MAKPFRKIEWSDELATGIEAIDLQHRRYLELVNRLLDHAIAVENAQLGREELLKSFEFLRNYACEHFGTEEPIMRDWHYPQFPEHRRQHQFFRERIDQLHGMMAERGYSRELMLQVNYFVVDWFINHIRTTDRKLGKFLEATRRERHPLATYLQDLARSLTARSKH